MRISSIIIFRLSKWWKAKFFILCDVIFAVRLQQKFDIDHLVFLEDGQKVVLLLQRFFKLGNLHIGFGNQAQSERTFYGFPTLRTALLIAQLWIPWQYVFDVPFISQRSSSWACKHESRDKISPRVQAPFSLWTFLRQMHSTNVSGSIEAKYWVSWSSFDV